MWFTVHRLLGADSGNKNWANMISQSRWHIHSSNPLVCFPFQFWKFAAIKSAYASVEMQNDNAPDPLSSRVPFRSVPRRFSDSLLMYLFLFLLKSSILVSGALSTRIYSALIFERRHTWAEESRGAHAARQRITLMTNNMWRTHTNCHITV